jgi:hypothetical protein
VRRGVRRTEGGGTFNDAREHCVPQGSVSAADLPGEPARCGLRLHGARAPGEGPQRVVHLADHDLGEGLSGTASVRAPVDGRRPPGSRSRRFHVGRARGSGQRRERRTRAEASRVELPSRRSSSPPALPACKLPQASHGHPQPNELERFARAPICRLGLVRHSRSDLGTDDQATPAARQRRRPGGRRPLDGSRRFHRRGPERGAARRAAPKSAGAGTAPRCSPRVVGTSKLSSAAVRLPATISTRVEGGRSREVNQAQPRVRVPGT